MGQFKGIDAVRADFIQKFTRLSGQQSGRLVKLIRSKSKQKDLPEVKKIPRTWWTQVRTEMQELIRIHTKKIYKTAAIRHGMPKDIAERKANEYSTKRATKAARSMAETSFDRVDSLRAKLDKRIDNQRPTTYEELRFLCLPVFSPQRGRNAAINETTLAASRGAQDAAKYHGLLDPDDEWKTNPPLSRTGPCPVCRPMNGKKRKNWPKELKDGPPAHIGCVCEVRFKHARKLGQRARRNANA